MLDPDRIETRYAKSGDLSIAYQCFGDGPVRMVYIPGWVSHVEAMWGIRENADYLRKLAAFAQVIVLDRRGTGLSDPTPNPPTLEERMDDVRAVMDAEGWDKAAIFGISEGGPMAIVFAATYPERTEALLLYGTFAKFSRDGGYPYGMPFDVGQRWIASLDATWGKGDNSKSFAPNRANDADFMRAMARLERQAMSPGTAKKLFNILQATDVRNTLSVVNTPTLILHRRDEKVVVVDHARYLAEHIPGARYLELPGDDHLPFLGDADTLLAEVREFLTGERAVPEPDRILATILFCDIVDSTVHATELGDKKWKDTLERFYALANEQLRHHRGRLLDTAGDGLFAAFDGPARAARCAAALCRAVEPLGLQLRAGVHTGECEVLGDKYSGIAVHIGARVAGCAEPGQVVATSTVKDLTAGSGIGFTDIGERTLKGIAEAWRLYRVDSDAALPVT